MVIVWPPAENIDVFWPLLQTKATKFSSLAFKSNQNVATSCQRPTATKDTLSENDSVLKNNNTKCDAV